MPGRQLSPDKPTSAAGTSKVTEIACQQHSVQTAIASADRSAMQLHRAAKVLSTAAADWIAEFRPKADRQIAKHLPSRIVAWRSADAASGMRRRTAHVEARNRHSIVAMAKHRASSEKLIQLQTSVHNIASGKAKDSFQIEGRQGLTPDDGGLKSVRIIIDGRDHEIGNLFAMVVPRGAVRQDRGHMLTE
jgi:hypothetical protein